MPANVFMPQMGESIAEGTIVRWIKRVGDHVDRDEPLFEISTDKVDAEIPSPAGGVLAEIRAKEGDTVPVNDVVAVIEDSPGAVAAAPPAAPARPAQPAAPAAAAGTPAVAPPVPPAARPPDAPGASAQPAAPAPARAAATEVQPPAVKEAAAGVEGPRQRSSPLVRRIAAEHGIDIAQIPGSGIGGRVTKHDILEFIESGGAAGARPAATGGQAAPAATAPAAPMPSAFGVRPGATDEIAPMSVMRRRIAEHMVASRRTSAHVHSVFEVDFSRVAKIREARKADYERAGARLTYLPFIVKAAIDALRAVPVVNASIDGDNVIYRKDINIGIAVALDWGLIVPVVRRADELSILGLTRAMHDLANRARSKQLKPDEVQGGTFTITNPGVFGALFGMPIISQPQVAILGVGAVEKRPVVVDDAIAIRPMAYLSLGYDHRLIDGAVADQFMSVVKKQIETFDPAAL
jgi:2-oxoglutarate dehydrogenase E2 component (dihydrolipoamide succinyltransferase)